MYPALIAIGLGLVAAVAVKSADARGEARGKTAASEPVSSDAPKRKKKKKAEKVLSRQSADGGKNESSSPKSGNGDPS